ncbi:TonB-dependent hemoglobin/transferrin/lactoferrin family receptor [Microvirga flavescens]|uniref:TonB-dependent hemoglobin/transferrin/lactoferrin family receptor n=1 Tax=Microvirga flavescens TaxID=2249811 RepID=UPI000DDB9B37|nr:TonB-dependent hemoglobin/transferrin/lactoferrin family receptor [Microvirga flavescens]
MPTTRFLGTTAILTAALLATDPVWAQATAPNGEAESTPIVLDQITVTATKAGENVYESLSPSSVLTRDELQSQVQPSSVSDVLRLIPGVTTQVGAGDSGTGVNIRGLQDFGRVNVLVDGARQNFQRQGHAANGTFYFDPEMMKSVDVTRGPVSSIYGSGAIGGVASFTTLDADDVIGEGRLIGARLKTGFETNGSTPVLHGEVATKQGAFDILGAATWRSAGDYTSGDGRVVRDTAQDLLSGLFKSRIRPADDQELTLSALRIRNTFDGGLSTNYHTDAIADTYTAGYRWTPVSDLWNLSAKVYFTGTDVKQTVNDGIFAGATKSFRIGTTGFDLFNTSRLTTGAFSHEITYGGDFFEDNVKTRDSFGTSDQLTPSGTRLAYGTYLQDKVRYSTWLEVIGGLRYDSYRLSGSGIENDGQRVSPKFTVGVTPWDPITFYGTYAEGYRAPSLNETLIDGFHPPPVSAGRFFPNPDLKPEVAHTVEAGTNLRFNGLLQDTDRLRLKLGVFRNTVDDYIEQVFTPFPIPGGYQYQNIAKAKLHGFEAEGIYDAGTVFLGLGGQIMEGKNAITGDPLNKVPPNRLTTTLGFRLFEERLELGTRVTWVAEKKNAAALGFIGEPYTLVDLFADWNVSENVKAGLVIENLFDVQYTQYLNAQPSPGLNAKAALTVKLY